MSLVSIEGTKITEPTFAARVQRPRARNRLDSAEWVETVRGSRLKKAVLRFLLKNF